MLGKMSLCLDPAGLFLSSDEGLNEIQFLSPLLLLIVSSVYISSLGYLNKQPEIFTNSTNVNFASVPANLHWERL